MKKILIIDDDASAADLAVSALEDEGYTLEQAPDGKKGLAKAAQFKPDLVIVDLMMPGVHGFQVCETLKESEFFAGGRILVTSSKSYPVDKDAARNSGADAYLTKPYLIAELRRKVRELLGK